MELIKDLAIKIKYFNDSVPRLKKLPQGDWIDLAVSVDTVIPKHTHVLVPLGVAMELPKGYEAHLAPRSSLFKKHGLIVVNSVGVIDESYCGDEDEWKLSVYCLEPKFNGSFSELKAGERIAQFRIIKKMPSVNFIEVDSLQNPSRGGFGSTN